MTDKPNRLLRTARTAKSTESETPKAASWLTRGKDQVAKERQATRGTDFAARPQDFFLSESGDKALIRLLLPLEKLEAAVARHSYKRFTKNGKEYYPSFTCTRDPKTCAGCANGDKASIRLPLIVIDQREMEYKDKEGNKTKKSNVPKLWLPSINELDNIAVAVEEFREDQKDENADTHNSVIRVTRLGKGTSTKYRFSIVKSGVKLNSEAQANLAEFEKEFGGLEKILAPISIAQQKGIIGNSGKGEEEDDTELDDLDDDEAEEIDSDDEDDTSDDE